MSVAFHKIQSQPAKNATVGSAPRRLAASSWLIRGILPRQGLVALQGPGERVRVADSIAANVANATAGATWGGRRVYRGGEVLVLANGDNWWLAQEGIFPEPPALDLLSEASVAAFIGSLVDEGLALLAIEGLPALGVDPAHAEQMTRAAAALEQIAQALCICVLLVDDDPAEFGSEILRRAAPWRLHVGQIRPNGYGTFFVNDAPDMDHMDAGWAYHLAEVTDDHGRLRDVIQLEGLARAA
ncbi:MAG: hypothetical protein ACTHJG_00120 [Rhodanobacteraceae bacterium]